MPLIELPPLHDGRSDKREVFKLINQMRGSLNLFPNVFSTQLTTSATGLLTTIWGSAMNSSSAVKLYASILGCTDDLTQSAAYTLECAVIDSAGTLAFTGGSFATTFSRETVVGTDAQFVISGNQILVQVQDGGVKVTHWTATVYADVLA